jgi:hypothetical protein
MHTPGIFLQSILNGRRIIRCCVVSLPSLQQLTSRARKIVSSTLDDSDKWLTDQAEMLVITNSCPSGLGRSLISVHVIAFLCAEGAELYRPRTILSRAWVVLAVNHNHCLRLGSVQPTDIYFN